MVEARELKIGRTMKRTHTLKRTPTLKRAATAAIDDEDMALNNDDVRLFALQDGEQENEDEDDEGNAYGTYFQNVGYENLSLDDFEKKRVIGRGAFGKVFLVQQKHTCEVFAMKAIRKLPLLKADMIARTALEKDIMMQIKHPFIINLVNVFQSHERVFFIMKFIRGGELFYHLRQVTRFNEERVKFYVMQIAMAIGELHKFNIIYRDLKPENVLINEDGYITLIDFGLSKMIEHSDELTFSFVGTPDYMAPEIINERGHQFAADWWALGILTYEMITGFPPFYTGDNDLAKLFDFIKKRVAYFPDQERH